MFEIFGEDGVLKKFDILDQEGHSFRGPGDYVLVLRFVEDFVGFLDEVADRFRDFSERRLH